MWDKIKQNLTHAWNMTKSFAYACNAWLEEMVNGESVANANKAFKEVYNKSMNDLEPKGVIEKAGNFFGGLVDKLLGNNKEQTTAQDIQKDTERTTGGAKGFLANAQKLNKTVQQEAPSTSPKKQTLQRDPKTKMIKDKYQKQVQEERKSIAQDNVPQRGQ